jgi:hypothetical protein
LRYVAGSGRLVETVSPKRFVLEIDVSHIHDGRCRSSCCGRHLRTMAVVIPSYFFCAAPESIWTVS